MGRSFGTPILCWDRMADRYQPLYSDRLNPGGCGLACIESVRVRCFSLRFFSHIPYFRLTLTPLCSRPPKSSALSSSYEKTR